MIRPRRTPNLRWAAALWAMTLGCRTPAEGSSYPPAADADAPAVAADAAGSDPAAEAKTLAERYEKREVRIPMRDGTVLFTAIYSPRDRSRRPLPMLLKRTPYSVSPYGPDEFPDRLGPSEAFSEAGYIFVYQDVRGRFMSQGRFINMTPHNDRKSGPKDVDESTDTFDTIAWLLDNVDGNNGKVGQWGISYPGFYAAAGMIDHHPALVAVSPQAPIADWFFDDFHHHGAFFLPHAFNFLARFGLPRDEPTTQWPPRFEHGTPDGYRFFLDLGPLRNANDRHLHDQVAFWNAVAAHPNYDGFWKARNLLPHLRNVAPAVMTVGGLFDAEDLYGPLSIYREIEAHNPGVFNILVMGPWRHGGWSKSDGTHLGEVDFGAARSVYYRQEIEFPFFEHFLRGGPRPDLPEALVFETGRNRWRRFDAWPPPSLASKSLYLGPDGGLSWSAPTAKPRSKTGFDAWISDPARPVPFTQAVAIGMTAEYMTDDQRFASRRPDVMVYRSEPLAKPLTVAGPIEAELFVSTDRTAADFVVKVIDVHPPDATGTCMPEMDCTPGEPRSMGGYEMMVRSEVIRGRFREGYDRPKPFVPGAVTKVRVPLQDVLHTFEPGHRIMVHIQSTWFPLVDRNPQRYVPNIFEATPSDFVVARHRVYRSARHPTHLRVGVLPQD